MTPSIDTRVARRAYQQLIGALHANRIRAAIDAPIERALRAFTFRWESFSTRAFHTVVTDFVGALARQGTTIPEFRTCARDAALALLDVCYAGPQGRGYGEALLDAADDPDEGISSVLLRFAEGLKHYQQQRYLAAVLHHHLRRLSPEERLALAQLVLDQAGGAGSAGRFSGLQLVRELPAAIMTMLQAEAPATQIVSRPYFA